MERSNGRRTESRWTNQVGDLVDLSAGRKTFGNLWILKIKRNPDGSIERYKAQIIAKLNLELVLVDIKTALLHGELDEEIFMDQPKGFRSEGQKSEVFRLMHSIYGLKQSSR